MSAGQINSLWQTGGEVFSCLPGKEDGMETKFRERIDTLDRTVVGEDAEYTAYREQYRSHTEKMKGRMETGEDRKLLMELDEIFGRYSGRYGEILYEEGFRDGLEIGLEHGKRKHEALPLSVGDMEQLLAVSDSYDKLCRTLFADAYTPCVGEGVLGDMERLHTLIEKYIIEDLCKGDDAPGYRIMRDAAKSPAERARILLGIRE